VISKGVVEFFAKYHMQLLLVDGIFYSYTQQLVFTRASAGLCDSNVSRRLSITSWYCVKTKKASVMISSLSGSSTILVF